MIKRFTWKEGDVYIFHAGFDAYTIGQVVKKNFILFFNYFSKDKDIKSLDLNKLPILFCCGIPQFAVKKFASHKVDSKSIHPIEGYEVSTLWIAEDPPFSETFEIYLWECLDYSLTLSNSNVIKKLDLKKDKKVIEEYEMMNLRTDIGYRLSLCKEAKENLDPLKDYLLGKTTLAEYSNSAKEFRGKFEKMFK